MTHRSEGFFSLSNLGRGLVLAAIVVFGYFVPNLFILFPVHAVLLTRFDHWVPLQPAWIWFYIAYYPLLIAAYFMTTGTTAQRVYFGSIALSSTVGFFVFLFFPTTIPRDLYPWTGAWDASAAMLAHIRGADEPFNCLPSMHVCASFIAAACISLVTGRTGRLLVWSLFLAICYSTMATKQHYFVDLVAGFALGATCTAIFMVRHHLLPAWTDVLSGSSSFKLASGASRASSTFPRSRAQLRAVVSKLRRRG